MPDIPDKSIKEIIIPNRRVLFHDDLFPVMYVSAMTEATKAVKPL